ncbi:MAG: phosphodiesterase [Deltaproteobacteria bacterium ADurb.Bin510]|nr:MAG: phosphodiesterase [Deltaproteobacteria bacterium ADurb.Bin510]
MDPAELERYVASVSEIPTLPTVATAIMEKTLDSNVNAQQIAELIEKDQALAIKVLKIANSAFYRRIKEISTIRGAVVVLGMNVLKSIVLSISVVNLFDNKHHHALDLFQFWQHSIACAVCAREIAARLAPATAEDAFMAGLLHDLGKVVIDQQLCRGGEYQEVLDMTSRGQSLMAAEREILGFDHAQLGKLLAERWNLPAQLAAAIALHHEAVPAVDEPETKRLCQIVYVADLVTNHLGLGVSQFEHIDPTVLKQLNLSSQDMQEVSLRLKDDIKVISDQLGIPGVEPKTYFEVLQSANAQLGRLSLDLEQKKQALELRALELANLNQMSSELQAFIKLPEIVQTLCKHTLAIMNPEKARCIVRLNQQRLLVTEAHWENGAIECKSGAVGATKELLDRTSGVYPPQSPLLHAALRVDGSPIGTLEAIYGAKQDDLNQRRILLRTIAEIGTQAIQRAMLITKNIKAQRLAAVSKTAIAANHEINSPLTTILLKLDMLIGSGDNAAAASLKEIRQEALRIQELVKRMLEISDVVETDYANNEKMLDLKRAVPAAAPTPSPAGRQAAPAQTNAATAAIPITAPEAVGLGEAGFEDYARKQPTEQDQAALRAKGDRAAEELGAPGFEDYLNE